MLIANPFATTTTANRRGALAAELAEHVEVVPCLTEYRGHAVELGARAVEHGFDAVFVHGGDGSVNEVVNGILGPPDSGERPAPEELPALGVVPGGNANVFARALGVGRRPQDATRQLLAALDSGRRRTIGLGHTLGRWFLFNAGMGIDATVVRQVEEARHGGAQVGNVLYLRSVLRSFLRPDGPAPTFTVAAAGHAPVEGVRFGFVSNASPWTYLGARPIRTNPGTSFDRGLGLTASTSLSVVRNLGFGAQLLAGSRNPRAAHLVRDDDVEWVRFRGAEPADVQVDGDYMGQHRDLDFGCAHGVIDVLVP